MILLRRLVPPTTIGWLSKERVAEHD